MPHTRPDLSVSNAIYFSSGRRNKLWATCGVAIYSCCTRKYKRLFSIQTAIFCPSPESYIPSYFIICSYVEFILAPHHLEIIVKFPPRFFSLIILSVLQQYLLKQQSSNQRSSLCP